MDLFLIFTLAVCWEGSGNMDGPSLSCPVQTTGTKYVHLSRLSRNTFTSCSGSSVQYLLLLVVMDPGHARVSLLSDGVQTHIPGRLNLAPS